MANGGGTVQINDNVQISGDLDVNGTGTHTFAGPVTVTGNITGSGVLDMNGTGTNHLQVHLKLVVQ